MFTRILAFIAMDGIDRHALLLKLVEHLLGTMLGAHKDHSAGYFRLMTDVFKHLLLIDLAGHDQALVHTLSGG